MDKKSGRFTFKKSLKNGFSLSEILLVVAIIAILVAMALFNYKTQIHKGFDKKRKDHLARLKIAFEDYYNDHNCYPDSTLITTFTCEGQQLNPYMQAVPCDPRGSQYIYDNDGTTCPQWFEIYTNLEYFQDEIINDIGCQSGCGSGNDYNYGVSSSNVSVGTVPGSSQPPSGSASPYPSDSGYAWCSEYYGCIGGSCVSIGPTQVCEPNYCTDNCDDPSGLRCSSPSYNCE